MVMKRIFSFAASVAVLFSVALLPSACSSQIDPVTNPQVTEYYLMTLYNNSSISTVWVFPEHGDVPCDVAGALPDVQDEEDGATVVCRIAPKRSVNIVIHDDGNDSAFETYHIDDSLPVYVFAEKDFDSIPWSQLKAEKKWLAKYSFTVEEMIEADQWIEYRPNS